MAGAPCLNCKDRWVDVDAGKRCHTDCIKYNEYLTKHRALVKKEADEAKKPTYTTDVNVLRSIGPNSKKRVRYGIDDNRTRRH